MSNHAADEPKNRAKQDITEEEENRNETTKRVHVTVTYLQAEGRETATKPDDINEDGTKRNGRQRERANERNGREKERQNDRPEREDIETR